ncbi:MAG: glycosyltransferase family 4 protein [Actinobacteria bacterium]|nr:glycosyltransferase family 4 protein [Actinomycetota bacterium]
MRILYLTQSHWPYIGGIETISQELIEGLHGPEFEFCVLTFRDDPALPATDMRGGVPIRRLDVSGAFKSRDAVLLASICREVTTICREWDPDLIHVAFTPPTGFLAFASRLRRIAPLLVSVHGWWPALEESNPTATRRAIVEADWVTAVSRSCLDGIRAFEPAVTERSSWVLNGLEPDPTPPRPLPYDPPVVVGAGRLSQEKGFDVLVRAFAGLRKQFPDARLVLAGRGISEDSLHALVAELGVADSVDFRGWVRRDDIPALLEEATVVAVPSREEGFGMTALEAATRARPVVATRIGGLPEVVEDGVTGVLIDQDSPDQLHAAMHSLIADRAHATELGEAARRRAEQLFSRERLLSEHVDLYRRLGARAAEPAVGL